MYSARDIFTMSLLLADFDRAALRVEGDERIAEQPLDVAAARHIRGREVAQHGWVDQGDRVAERKGDVQFVCREEDALAVVVCQLSQQRAEFVTVRQVEERGRLVEQDDRGVLGQGGRSLPAGIRRRTCGPSFFRRKLPCRPVPASVPRWLCPVPVRVRSSWCRGSSEGYDIFAPQIGNADPFRGDETDGGGQLLG